MARQGELSVAPGEQRYVALLRGVNVGGKNKLPMADLRDAFTAAGCTGVRTYIQSGNVAFEAAPTLAGRVPELVTRAISRRFGISTAVVVRSGGNDNPFWPHRDDRFGPTPGCDQLVWAPPVADVVTRRR